MHERHDPDLIAAYADGDLESDTTLAEELVASCEQCRVEYDTQRQIGALLREAPLITMTEEERDLVHRSVLDRLDEPVARPDETTVISLDTRRRSTRRWLAVGSVAAVTLAVVGVGGVMLNSIDGDSATFDAAATATTQAADGTFADESRIELQMDDAAEEADDGGADETTALASGDASATTAAAEAAEVPEASFLPYLDAGPGPVSEEELDVYVSETLIALETGAPAEELTAAWFNTNDKPSPTCIASVEDPIFAVINASVDGDDLEVLVVRNEDATFEARTFVVPDCVER
jgi:hypothetical protein